MIYGHRHQGGYEIPEWAGQLKHYYWVIRVEGRDKAKRRRYYRYVAKEKLRLVEKLHIEYYVVYLVCRYLSSLSNSSGAKLQHELLVKNPQLSFKF